MSEKQGMRRGTWREDEGINEGKWKIKKLEGGNGKRITSGKEGELKLGGK